jgi:hypothetical protein
MIRPVLPGHNERAEFLLGALVVFSAAHLAHLDFRLTDILRRSGSSLLKKPIRTAHGNSTEDYRELCEFRHKSNANAPAPPRYAGSKRLFKHTFPLTAKV